MRGFGHCCINLSSEPSMLSCGSQGLTKKKKKTKTDSISHNGINFPNVAYFVRLNGGN